MFKTHIDFETRSVAELARQNAVGEHAYAQHESTDALLLGFKTIDTPQVKVADLLNSAAMPPELVEAVDRGDTFVAHNARFEQAIWYWQMHRRHGWPLIEHWSCTAARARYWGLRASLDGVCSDLETPHQKNKRGEELIKIFCKPRKKIKGVIRKAWAEPWEMPAEWEEFKQYCGEDVYAEIDVDGLLPELPEFEQRNWELDYKMNWRGLPIDMEMVRRATVFCEHYTDQAFAKFDELTNGLRPTQRAKVLEYLQQREVAIDDMKAKTLKRIVLADFDSDIQDMITIRLETAKASVKKLAAMIRCTTDDGLARGLVLYYGAHTGRDSGKRVQPQNFIRGNKRMQGHMFQFLEGEWWDTGEWQEVSDLIFPRPLDALAQSMKGFICAPKGERFVIADYAQIEARVLVWLARAEEKLQFFHDGKDTYCRFAAQMYGREYGDYFHTVDGKLERIDDFDLANERQLSKHAELGCGFGLGGEKFVEYCDDRDIIIQRDVAIDIVKKWRLNNPEIVAYWARMEKAAKVAVWKEESTGQPIRATVGNIAFFVHRIDAERYWLRCELPSGRHISYYRPKLRDGVKWGKPITILSFRTEWVGRTVREDTYGGKITENAVQGTARDIMKLGVLNAEDAGYAFRLPIHDAGLFTMPFGKGSYQELEGLLCQQDPWVTDCPIVAEGKECIRYVG